MKHKFLLIYSYLVRTLLYFFPDIPLFMRFRGWLYGLGMIKCGRNFQVTHDAILRDLGQIKAGNNNFVGNQTVMWGGGIIDLHNNILIGPHCTLISSNHSSKNGSYYGGGSSPGLIIIKSGSWIAANCTIAKGAVLPENSVLGANSLLNKAFSEPNSIYGGVPAKFIKANKPDI